MNKAIISKLQDWIEPLSVNQIKNISPSEIREELGISSSELLDVIKFLKDKRIIRYRYRFFCDNCNSECVAYEQELINDGHTCSECGKNYYIYDIRKNSQVVYEFIKPRLLALNQSEKINFTEEAIKENVIKFQDIKEDCGEKLMSDDKIKIFFGSSKEATDVMCSIAALVGGVDGCRTVTWDSPDLDTFIAGDTTIESLITTTHKVNGAIFIFNNDDETWYRGDKQGTVRDNVLFECGLFMGALGKKNVAIVTKNKPRLASDLSGIKYIDGNKDTAIIRVELTNWLNRVKESCKNV